MCEINPLFFAVSILAILAPGPDILYTIARGISSGPKAAVVAASGFACGLSVHTSLAVLGLSALLRDSAPAFLCVKIVGAAYLTYLGIRAWGSQGLIRIPAASGQPPLKRIFGQAFLMNILNPKVAIFFLSFFPQFVRPENGPLPHQFLMLGIWFAILTLLLFSTAGICASFLAKRLLSNSRLALYLDRTVGTLFIALGVKLALSGSH